MDEATMAEVNELLRGKIFLTLEDVAQLLGCDPQIVHNWTRRSDPGRRPPPIMVGKELRFPKHEFLRWLLEEQVSVGE